jgi:hypothetical protein
VATESPIGDRNSSAQVNNSRIATSAKNGVLLGPPPANGMNSRKASPMNTKPRENFTGVLGCREPSLVHRPANTPAKMMMKMGLMDCTKLGGMIQPKKFRSRLSCE